MNNAGNHKIKIAFLYASLHLGGTEKMLTNILKYLNLNKYEVTLVLLDKSGIFLNNIPKEITIVNLNIKNFKNIFNIIRLLFYIRSLKVDIIFSWYNAVSYIIGFFNFLLPNNKKYIIREQSTPNKNSLAIGYKQRFLMHNGGYKNLDKIIVQTKLAENELTQQFRISPKTISVIANGIDLKELEKKISIEQPNPFPENCMKLISVGRIHPVKGYDLLINILHKIKKHTNFYLIIIGREEDSKYALSLKQIINQYQLNDNILFLGEVLNPLPIIKYADMLMISSRYEGFPNIILESNYCGIPALVTDAIEVASLIIEEGVNGAISSYTNEEFFYKKLNYLIENFQDKEKIKSFVAEKYNLKEIINKYEEAIDGLI